MSGVSDSLFCKLIYITCSGYCEVEKRNSTSFFIVGESFSWKLTSMGKFLFSVQTYGSSAVQLLLGTGLQALRVWYSLPTNYSIQVLSKSPFSICTRERAQELLSLPSITEKTCAIAASNAFKILLESTGSPVSHGNSLKDFIESLQPIYFHKQLHSWNARFCKRLQIWEAVERIAVEIILEKHETVDSIRKAIHTLRKLFLNPRFGKMVLQRKIESSPEILDKLNSKQQYMSLEEMIDDIENYEASPTEVPEVKSDKKPAKSGKKETEKEDYTLLSNPDNMITLFRKLLEKCPDVQKYYPFNDCVRSQLAYIEYNGNAEILLSGKILFLIRYIINVSNEDAMPFGFHIFTAMEKLVVRVINNDTGDELPFGLSENSTYFLSHNSLGYTVFAYGEVDTLATALKQTEMPWKLRVLGSVEHKFPHAFSPFQNDIEEPPPSIKPLHFEGLYLPEKDNIFCRCILNVKGNAVVTLHLIASSDTACITLRLKGNRQKCLAEAEGIHEVIIPIVFLYECDGIPSVDGEGVIFAVEGHVVKETWVLSDDTVTALRYLREMRNEAGVKRLKKSSRKSSIVNVPGAELLPTWFLSAVFDSPEVENCKLLPDTQSEDEIRRQKDSWISGGEGRREQGLKIKNEFLAQFSDGKTN